MPEIQVKTHNTQVLLYYCNFLYENKQFSNSFYPYFTKKWNVNKAPKYKFYFRGSTKRECSLLTQFRVGRSILNVHAFPLGLSSSPKCLCHAPTESPRHMLLKCFMYYEEHLTLLSEVENLLPKLKTLRRKNNFKYFYLDYSQTILTTIN